MSSGETSSVSKGHGFEQSIGGYRKIAWCLANFVLICCLFALAPFVGMVAESGSIAKMFLLSIKVLRLIHDLMCALFHPQVLRPRAIKSDNILHLPSPALPIIYSMTQRIPPLQPPPLQNLPPVLRPQPRQKPMSPLPHPMRRIICISLRASHLQ